MNDWERELRKERTAKNEHFAEHPHSPVPPDQREAFEGLEYFPPDPGYRFITSLDEFDEKETIIVKTTQDGERPYLRWGEFEFEHGEQTYTLTAYKHDPDEEQLWVPFRDETNGTETYDAGRYLDLDAGDQTQAGTWILDFNRAYSPFCAFSDVYECPVVPMENWLETRIEAGERVLD
jgi:uncharacterized protein (DUF1684 family)